MAATTSSLRPADGIAATRAVLTWCFDGGRRVLSSAPVGGGLRFASWIANVGVDSDYDRTDLATHAGEVATTLRLAGEGVTMFTAVDVGDVVRRSDGDVVVDATVGISHPTWAAAAGAPSPTPQGTINIVVQVPVPLTDAAAVNAVMTVTEAKAQALADNAVAGTGTASDALALVWPGGARAEAFAGPRSTWGARIARATHAAVVAGVR